MNHAIILAGGSGRRFWPLSRESSPKQFLNICSTKPLIEETIGRVSPLIRKENIYISTTRFYNKEIKECVSKENIPFANVFLEPEAKNTLAPIVTLSSKINKLDPSAVIAVLPSDHFIKDRNRFLKLLAKGIEVAQRGHIVVLGIPPKRPETGYGYIKIKSKIKDFFIADKFIEKPDLNRAKNFIKDKKYYWNGGIFIFSSGVMLEEVNKFVPYIRKFITNAQDEGDYIRLWSKLPSTSIDYAIMEKTGKMALLPADCGWIDLGSWESIGETAKKDKNGNIFRGRYIDIGSKNTSVLANNRLVATLGLKDIIIVDTKDALLVCRRDKGQDVKKIVQRLKRRHITGAI